MTIHGFRSGKQFRKDRRVLELGLHAFNALEHELLQRFVLAHERTQIGRLSSRGVPLAVLFLAHGPLRADETELARSARHGDVGQSDAFLDFVALLGFAFA